MLVDDLLATGGTLAAATKLVAMCGAEVMAHSVMFELESLKGRDCLTEPVLSLVQYS